MTSPKESSQTRKPDYEPRSPEERINNKSIHFRLSHRVVNQINGWGSGSELFTKPDNSMEFVIRNIPPSRRRSTYADPMIVPDWFSCPSSLLRIINKNEYVAPYVVTYLFNNKGHSIKEEVTHQEQVGSGTWSSMSPEDYDNVHQALVLAESGEI